MIKLAAAEQEQLGDPSGKSSAEYWNDWFQKISPDGKFEWYCDTSEIARILHSYCYEQRKKKEELYIIHPGSGNSSVPFSLRDEYGFSCYGKQCLIDCSTVAFQQLQERTTSQQQSGLIEFEVGDVLQPPLPYSDNLFDVWVDKGLLDALFCGGGGGGGDNDCHEVEQCSALFQEAHRVLKPNGLCIIISLAQDHTLNLLLHASGFFTDEEGRPSSEWLRPMEIHEIKPLSDASSLRPFALILRSRSPSSQQQPLSSSSNTMDDLTPIIAFFDENGIVQDSISQQNFCWEAVHKLVQSSQQRYVDQWKLKNHDSLNNTSECYYKNDNHHEINYVLSTICIKPWDVETNLHELKERIKGNEEYDRFDLTWKAEEIKGIGFGIFSLQMSLVIPQENLEELCECIASQEEDLIQSVDVDWQSTCRVFTNNAKRLLK